MPEVPPTCPCISAEVRAKINQVLESMPECGPGSAPAAAAQLQVGTFREVPKGRKRRPSARSVFMKSCLSKPEKGGLGLPMADCSSRWKGMGEPERAPYVQQAASGGT